VSSIGVDDGEVASVMGMLFTGEDDVGMCKLLVAGFGLEAAGATDVLLRKHFEHMLFVFGFPKNPQPAAHFGGSFGPSSFRVTMRVASLPILYAWSEWVGSKVTPSKRMLSTEQACVPEFLA
jgi:hypothetical protein